MPKTYELIQETTLSSASAEITFSSIPATYSSLRLVTSTFRSNTATSRIRFNGDTGSNHGAQFMTWTNANEPAPSGYGGDTGIYFTGAQYGASATYPALFITDILGYNNTAYMTAVNHAGGHASGTGTTSEWFQLGGAWYNTAVVTSITLTAASGTFNTGSTARLYGILGA